MLSHFGDRIIYDSTMHLNAKMEMTTQDRQWRLTDALSHQLLEFRTNTPADLFPDEERMDEVKWIYGNSGEFSIQSAWNCWRSRISQVSWKHLIWFPVHIPRFSTIVWLAIKERLSTWDRLPKFGIKDNPNCGLCESSEKSQNR